MAADGRIVQVQAIEIQAPDRAGYLTIELGPSRPPRFFSWLSHSPSRFQDHVLDVIRQRFLAIWSSCQSRQIAHQLLARPPTDANSHGCPPNCPPEGNGNEKVLLLFPLKHSSLCTTKRFFEVPLACFHNQVIV